MVLKMSSAPAALEIECRFMGPIPSKGIRTSRDRIQDIVRAWARTAFLREDVCRARGEWHRGGQVWTDTGRRCDLGFDPWKPGVLGGRVGGEEGMKLEKWHKEQLGM